MNSAIWAAIIVAFPSIAIGVGGALVRRRTRQKQEIVLANSDALKPYREAFEGAMAINRELQEGLRKRVVELEKQAAELERQVATQHALLEQQQAVIDKLTRLMREHNIELPA